jgi:hypothetical protein
MQTNDENNDDIKWKGVTAKGLSTWDVEDGNFANEEDENKDMVPPSNISSERRITGGQMKSVWRHHHYSEQ